MVAPISSVKRWRFFDVGEGAFECFITFMPFPFIYHLLTSCFPFMPTVSLWDEAHAALFVVKMLQVKGFFTTILQREVLNVLSVIFCSSFVLEKKEIIYKRVGKT